MPAGRPISTLLNGASAGWFGKIPALGDFATRRLPASFVGPWDDWLSTELGDAQRALADAWDDRYERAPILCFSLSEGTVDARGWHGILMPSIDRVGRRFPLTIACPAPCGVSSLPAPPWWGAAVAAGCLAVNPGCGVDELDGLVARLPTVGERCAASGLRCGAPGERDAGPAAAALEDGRSAWWRWSIDGAAAAGSVIADDLPRGAHFRELLHLSEPTDRSE